MKLVISTHNKNKFNEISSILKSWNEIKTLEIFSLYDFKEIPKIEEDGKTLQENAVKKALFTSKWTGLLSISDDTGLEVKYLSGMPGVYSARFAGPDCSYKDNNLKLLELLKEVPYEKRESKFSCVIVVAKPSGDYFIVESSINGFIADQERGTNGFGYDPLFIVPLYNKTLAELSPDVKNSISHRAIAVEKSKKIIINLCMT